jgi:hypothetical protein
VPCQTSSVCNFTDPTYALSPGRDSLKANICSPEGVTGARIIEIVSDRKTAKTDIAH